MICLDTSALLDLMGRGGKRRQAAARDAIQPYAEHGRELVTTRANVAELHVGVELATDRAVELERVETVLRLTRVLELTAGGDEVYGKIKARARRAGRLPGDLDLLIAAIVIAEGEARPSLLTHNAKHFADIPELEVVTYGRK